MCFDISKGAKPWTKRYVWKVVRARRNTRGRLTLHSPQRAGIEYKIGVKHRIPKDAVTTDSHRTIAGLYVLRTFAAAAWYAHEWCLTGSAYRIVKLEVEPKDFLFAGPVSYGRHKSAATYRAVRVLNVMRKAPRYS